MTLTPDLVIVRTQRFQTMVLSTQKRFPAAVFSLQQCRHWEMRIFTADCMNPTLDIILSQELSPFSPGSCPGKWEMGAYSQCSDTAMGQVSWLFPPVPFISKAIWICKEHQTEAVLVCPGGRDSGWWPQLSVLRKQDPFSSCSQQPDNASTPGSVLCHFPLCFHCRLTPLVPGRVSEQQ